MNLKKLIASLVLFTQATNAFAIGQASTQVYADKIKSNAGGTINTNASGTVTIPNITDTLAGITSPTISNPTFTGTTTFPGTSSVNGSGNAIFGGTGNIAGATLIGAAGSADSKSIFELQSTTKGFLPPRMTTAQKNAIASPTTGLVVYDTDLKSLQVYNATSWVTAGSGGLSYAADTGAANAYAIAPTPAALAYNTGDTYIFKAVNANTTSSTLNVSTLGVKNIKTPQVANLPANAILAGAIVLVVYDGTQFQIINAQDPTIISPLTTKGDVATYSTVPARLAVPGDYGRMVPDSNATTGWRPASYTQFQNGAPTKNYIQYADFENNATTGWTATGCATVTNGLCASVGSGGTAFSSANGGRAKGANTSSPAIDSGSNVSGTYSLNLATTAAGTIGDGYVSSLYPIDPSDRGKVLSWKLNYKVASGTPVMQGTSTNTYAALIYDPVNNSWLGTTGAFNFVQSSGVGTASGTVQTLSTTTSVQIFVYSPVAPTGASSLLVDDFYVGPQTLNYGPAVTDTSNTLSPTPNGFGSLVSSDYRSWRIGDRWYVRGYFKSGTVAGTTASISLPAGLTIDSSKMTSTTNTQSVGEAWSVITSAVSSNFDSSSGHMTLFYDGSTTDRVFFAFSAASNQMTKANGSAIASTNDSQSFEFSVPISGWGGNSVQSADSDTRVIGFVASSPTATVTGSASDVSWTVVRDDCGGFDGTKNYTICVTGWYDVEATFRVDATYAAGNDSDIYILKNTVAYLQNLDRASGAQVSMQPRISSRRFFNAGDVLRIQVASAGTTPTVTAGTTWSEWSVIRRSGPAVTAASEKIYAFYTGNAGTVLTANTTNVDWSTKVQNSHGTGVFDGTTFTAPRPVFCQFSGSFFTTAGVTATFSYYVNATIKQALGGGTSARTFPFSFGYYLNQGDTLTFRTDTGATLSNSATLHWISVLCP